MSLASPNSRAAFQTILGAVCSPVWRITLASRLVPPVLSHGPRPRSGQLTGEQRCADQGRVRNEGSGLLDLELEIDYCLLGYRNVATLGIVQCHNQRDDDAEGHGQEHHNPRPA